jgi:hypothetical protein
MSVNPTKIPEAPSVPYFFRPLKEVKGVENCSPNIAMEKAWKSKNSYKDILHPIIQVPLNNPSFFRRIGTVIVNFFKAAKNWIWNKLGYINSTKLAERTQRWAKVNDAIVTHNFAQKFKVLLAVPKNMEFPGLFDILFNSEYEKLFVENCILKEKKAEHMAKLSKLDHRAQVAFRKEYLAQTNKAKIESSKDFHQQVLDRYVQEMNARKVAQARKVRF